jgi:segregation and condensation protein B
MRRKTPCRGPFHQQLGRINRHALGRGWVPPRGLETLRGPFRSRRLRRARTVRPTLDEQTVPGLHHRSDELARLEAALFLAREPLSTRRLAKLARLSDGTRARVLIRELKKLQEEAGSAFRVEQIAGGFRLLTRAPLGPWVRRLLGTPPETRLSAAALETLAIVAYRQPVTRAEIEAIRGVGCEDMLRQLMERDFVAIGGRTEDLGRPNVYVTSRRFLQAFGLAKIEDLPRIEPFAPESAADAPDEPLS